MNTGEDIQGLRKIVDFIRLISISILAIHFYLSCYRAFEQWNLTADIIDRIISNIAKTGLFENILRPKLAALLLLLITLVAAKGKKDEKLTLKPIVAYLTTGLLLYFISVLVFYLDMEVIFIAVQYIGITTIGYLLMLTGGTLLSRLLREKLDTDIFNSDNETFPQEERLLNNEYSVNLPAKYNLKGKIRNSYINFISMTRGLLVAGTPGS